MPLSYPPGLPPSASVSRGGSLPRRALLVLLTLLLGLGTLTAGALTPASAAPVYKIDGTWIDRPSSISRGNPVVAEWRINVNDDRPAPSNEPIEDVTASFVVEKAFFDEIPNLCKTTGVTPQSRISPDGTRLTCNFGEVAQGSAIVMQVPIVANGRTGEFVQLSGTSPSGETEELPEIEIINPFVMDMQFAGTSNYNGMWDDVNAPTYVDVPFNWSLRMGDGSDPGPNTVSYRLTLVDVNGRPVVLGTHPTGVGLAKNYGVQGCTEHDLGNAEGHPYSTVPTNPWHTNFVDSCTLTPVAGQPGVFTLTITGINYDLQNAPTHDSFGNLLPADWDYVAAGQLWIRVLTSQSGSVRLTSDAPTYTAPTRQQYTDPVANNTATKTYTLPGGFSAAYLRQYTGNGGDRWDDTYRVAAGTTVWSYVANHFSADAVPATSRYGVCQVLDPQFVDFNPTAARPIEYWVSLENQAGRQLTAPPAGAVVEYYTGGVGDPNAFDCGTGTWSATQPANPATVTAVRMTYPHSSYAAEDAIGIQFRIPTRIQDNAQIGQDIWTFGSYLRNGTWVTGPDTPPGLTPTPGERYPFTNYRRDVLWVVLATPAIRKTSAQNTVTPGVPTQFTLTYSANGTGTIPPEVDDYVIRDTLPVGMTYVSGSASPEPVISMTGQRQVLTWTLDDVKTNTQHPLVYEAVVDPSVAPGTPLTNTAISSLAGEDSVPASKTVTTTTNGYTLISKTADTPFIPNVDGSGDGAGSWTVTLRSFDPITQAYTDVIDILPFKGDQRGTAYSGTYALDRVVAPGQTVYYTAADPATLSDDPNAPANGGANTPSTLWTTTRPANPTAIRVIGGALASGATRQFQIHVTTDGAMPKDLYVNRTQGRAEHSRLEMRTSAPMTMAHFYSANLKKYVQDAKGQWRDANDVADYPAFKIGDTVNYRIVITNTGQGTLTDVDVTDDTFDNGSFHVDELAPGESETHEFSSVIPNDAVGTLVNTACATAAKPVDADAPPTINCDPAGRELVNYVTKKVADPASGTPVQSGEVIRYTVSVTQQGTVPAAATLTDSLADVLDDAVYNNDVAATIGTVEYVNGSLVWNGTVPVGQVALVTYSVTVKGATELGNRNLVNPVASPGCLVKAGQTVDCDTTHRAPEFDLKINKKVVGDTVVAVGGKVRYKLQVTNRGPELAPAPITVTDKLPKGLELKAAKGTGWVCEVNKASDKLSCVSDTDLQVGQKAPVITVVAKANKDATDKMVNVAKVNANGDTVKKNNRDKAVVGVGAGVAGAGAGLLPSTGLRPLLRLLERYL